MTAITLIILGLATFMYLASRRLNAQAKELESRAMARITVFTAANDELRGGQRAQESLRDSAEKFHQLADNIQEIFWIVDTVTKQALYVNPAFEEITGRTTAIFQAPFPSQEIIFGALAVTLYSRWDGAGLSPAKSFSALSHRPSQLNSQVTVSQACLPRFSLYVD